MRKDWWAPLTGVAFVVLVIIGFAIGGEPPDADEPVREIVDHYVDNQDSIVVSSLIGGVALSALLFFAGHLRRALRLAEGPGGVLSAVAFAGAILIAAGAAFDLTLQLATAEAADDVSPIAVQTMQAIWDNDFLPMAVGAFTLLLASGLSIVRHGALPKWLGWIAIVLAVIGLTPAGFISFLAGGVWIVITSILLTLQLRREPPVAATTPAAPAGPV